MGWGRWEALPQAASSLHMRMPCWPVSWTSSIMLQARRLQELGEGCCRWELRGDVGLWRWGAWVWPAPCTLLLAACEHALLAQLLYVLLSQARKRTGETLERLARNGSCMGLWSAFPAHGRALLAHLLYSHLRTHLEKKILADLKSHTTPN